MKHPLSPLPALLALALGLTACAPAAPQSAATTETAPAAETAETAPAETAGEQAAFPVGKLVEGSALRQAGNACYTVEYDTLPDGSLLPRIVKLDYASAREESILPLEAPVDDISAFTVRDDTAWLVTGTGVLQIPLDGGAGTFRELDAPLSSFSFSAADEYALYGFSFAQPLGYRLDLQSGQFTRFSLPVQTEWVRAVGEDRFLLSRLLTQAPLPDMHNQNERYFAAIQSATREYDWFDPATGELEKIWSEPYYGVLQEDGTQQERSFLGKAGGRLYFRNVHVLRQGPGAERLGEEVMSCTLAGEDWQTVFSLPEGAPDPWPLCDAAMEMRWITVQQPGENLQVYDLTDGTWHTAGAFPVGFGMPQAFTDDGRVLVQTGEFWTGETYKATCTLMKAEDYLSGSTAGTPIQPYTG